MQQPSFSSIPFATLQALDPESLVPESVWKKDFKEARILFLRRSGLFDTEYYQKMYPDVAESNIDPLSHYVYYGAAEGRNPTSWFDTNFYMYEYPDAAQAAAEGLNPFYHYIRYGFKEYRKPNQHSKKYRVFPDSISQRTLLPRLWSKGDCIELGKKLGTTTPVIAIWATGVGQQTVDVFLLLRKHLKEAGYVVIFLLHKSGVERILKLCPIEDREYVYIFRDADLFAWCSFISILFSSEDAIGYNNKLQYFSGKLVLLAHTFAMTYPFESLSSLSADYVIAPSRVNKSFPFSWYPNIGKITHDFHLTIIPGYMKMDILAQKCHVEKANINRRISFFATLAAVTPQRDFNILFTEYVALIESFFAEYPDWEFVLRPFPGDKGNALFRGIADYFSSNIHFVYDTGSDAYKYLTSADILITDYSAVFTNFCYSTLRPVIWFRPNDPHFSSGRYLDQALGYATNSAQQALDALKDALANRDIWKEKILRVRDREVPHFGTKCKYISEHIENILHNKPADSWIVIDKGHTPCSQVADYLRLLKPAATKKALDPYTNATMMTWACKQHGQNVPIGLAVIRAYIQQWPDPRGFISGNFYVQVQSAFSFVPPVFILGLLRHMVKKDPSKSASVVWLAEALSRWEPDASDFSAILNRLKDLSMDSMLAGMASRLLYRHRKAPATALAVLQRALPEKQMNKRDSVYAVHAGLLWELGRYEECKQVVELWVNNRNIEWLPLGVLVFRVLLLQGKHTCLPKEFWRTGNITGTLATWFPQKDDLAVAEALVWEILEQNSSLGWAYIQLGNVHNARNELDDAIACARKAVEVQPDALWLRSTLAEWLRKKGDLEEVERIAYDTLEISPNQGWAYIQLSNVHNSRNELEDAIRCVRKAMEVQPDATWFQNNLNNLLRKQESLAVKVTS